MKTILSLLFIFVPWSATADQCVQALAIHLADTREIVQHDFTLSDFGVNDISPASEPPKNMLCGVTCMMKAEIKLKSQFGERPDPRETMKDLLSTDQVPYGLTPEQIYHQGLKVWQLRNWFFSRISQWAEQRNLQSTFRVGGSSFITGYMPTDITLEDLFAAGDPQHALLAAVHVWKNNNIPTEFIESRIQDEIWNASLDPGEADFRHWILIRNVAQTLIDGNSFIIATLEDPSDRELISGDLLPVAPAAYGFRTWRFYDPLLPKQLMILTGTVAFTIK